MTPAERALANKLKREDITVPEWSDEPLEVHELSAKEYEYLLSQMYDEDGKYVPEGQRIRLVVMTLFDKRGNRIFTDEQIEPLGDTPQGPVNDVYLVAARLNGFIRGRDEKNSLARHSGDSPSDSQLSVVA